MRRVSLVLIVSVLLFSCEPVKTVKFGVISDVHQDVMHDGVKRLRMFVDEMNVEGADFIIQLGDFCRPYDYNEDFLSIFNNHEGAEYHVIGNHEMDGGFSRDSVVKYFGMENNYYSYDQNGFHFIVLDGNDKNPDPNGASGYSRFIGEEQFEWLRTDLEATENQVVIFSHQGLQGVYPVENDTEVRALLESTNEKAGYQKVIASFNGHSHADTVFRINDIYYIEVNSSSYEWLGGDYIHESYSKEIHEEYPWISYTAPYEKPLWALIEISSKGEIRISGKQSNWVGKSPEKLGHPGRDDLLPSKSTISDTTLYF